MNSNFNFISYNSIWDFEWIITFNVLMQVNSYKINFERL